MILKRTFFICLFLLNPIMLFSGGDIDNPGRVYSLGNIDLFVPKTFSISLQSNLYYGTLLKASVK